MRKLGIMATLAILVLVFGVTGVEAKKPVTLPAPITVVTPVPIPDAGGTPRAVLIKQDTLDLNGDGVVDYIIQVKQGTLSNGVWTFVDYCLPECLVISAGGETYHDGVLVEDTFAPYTYPMFF